MIDSRLDTISACDRRTDTTRWQIPRYAEQERRSGNNVMVKSAPCRTESTAVSVHQRCGCLHCTESVTQQMFADDIVWSWMLSFACSWLTFSGVYSHAVIHEIVWICCDCYWLSEIFPLSTSYLSK